jgi:hypothetical protein
VTPASRPRSGSSASTGASEPLTIRAGVEQRAIGVGAVGGAGPEARGQVAVRGRARELHRRRDAELGEAPDVLCCEQLRVLDAIPQATPPRLGLGCGEAVEGVAVGQVADGVNRDREAGLGRAGDDVAELRCCRHLDTRAVEQPCRPRAERAVHEHLEVADAQEVVAAATADTGGDQLVELGVR